MIKDADVNRFVELQEQKIKIDREYKNLADKIKREMTEDIMQWGNITLIRKLNNKPIVDVEKLKKAKQFGRFSKVSTYYSLSVQK